MKICAFDIGGSKISYAAVDEDGQLVSEVSTVPTPQDVTQIKRIIQKALATDKYDGAAIASAGIVCQNKLQGKPNNLPAGYENINFAELLKLPYVLENDANAAAWAELKQGSLKDVQNGVLLTLGTDVGCTIIANGELVRGKCGAAGEYGFSFSGKSLRDWAEYAGLEHSDGFTVYEKSCRGDSEYRKVYNAWQEELISGLNMLNRLLDTEVISLSGSLAKIVDYAAVNTVMSLLNPHNPPQIKPAGKGTNAGLIGAALLLIDNIKKG